MRGSAESWNTTASAFLSSSVRIRLHTCPSDDQLSLVRLLASLNQRAADCDDRELGRCCSWLGTTLNGSVDEAQRPAGDDRSPGLQLVLVPLCWYRP
jgi:hypothetical protein